MAAKPFVTKEDRLRIISMANRGMTYSQIAQSVKRSDSTVRKVCREAGITRRLTPAQMQEIVRLRADGWTRNAVAQLLKVTKRTVQSVAGGMSKHSDPTPEELEIRKAQVRAESLERKRRGEA